MARMTSVVRACCASGCLGRIWPNNQSGLCAVHAKQAKNRRQYEENKDRANDRRKKRRKEASGLASIRKAGRKHYLSNKEKIAELSRAYRKANPDKIRAYAACRRTRILGAGGTHTDADIEALFIFYGWRCCLCAVDLTSLPRKDRQIDHIVPVSRGGGSGIENLQPLCRWCNMRKFDH